MKTTTLIFWVISYYSLTAHANAPKSLEVRESPAYELANIILALTSYGKSDPYEVNKESEYYQKVIKHFSLCSDHRLLKIVNYSRERWAEYLSFRSDAFAFELKENGSLIRQSSLRTEKDYSPFDDNIKLIQDFAINCQFNKFYNSQRTYYKTIRERYAQAYMFKEMQKFLTREFGQQFDSMKYIIAFSPLVGRMNAQRSDGKNRISFVSADPKLLDISSQDYMLESNRIEGIHSLFTELDHDYVNPVSDLYKKNLEMNFTWKFWDKKSGYESSYSTFNEYMTWAVYDIFIREYFKDRGETSIKYWHLQNKSRGFIASNLFAQQLEKLRKQNKTIKDTYPSIIKWANKVQGKLKEPIIEKTDSKFRDKRIKVNITFSTPMKQEDKIIALSVLHDKKKEDKIGPKIAITPKENKLRWSSDGRNLYFEVDNQGGKLAGVNINWWDITPFESLDGMLLKPYTEVRFSRK